MRSSRYLLRNVVTLRRTEKNVSEPPHCYEICPDLQGKDLFPYRRTLPILLLPHRSLGSFATLNTEILKGGFSFPSLAWSLVLWRSPCRE